PAMLSTVSLNAPVASIASPAKFGLDRALRTCLRGAARTRRTARATEPMTISVSRVEPEPSPETPNALSTARTRTRNRTIRKLTRRPPGPLRCLGPCGVDWVADMQAFVKSFLTTRPTGIDPRRPAQTLAPQVAPSSPERDDLARNRRRGAHEPSPSYQTVGAL